jgi:hypothetical protein
LKEHAKAASKEKDFRLLVGTETILVVEDNPQVQFLVGRTLRQQGYEVLEANCAEQALILVAELPTAIDLLLTDVVMPGMNGNELARILQKRRSDLKVLFMTGYSHDITAMGLAPDVGISMLRKPFTPELLALNIRMVLDHGAIL